MFETNKWLKKDGKTHFEARFFTLLLLVIYNFSRLEYVKVINSRNLGCMLMIAQ